MTSFNDGIEAAAQELQRAAEILEQSCGGMWSKAAQQRALLKRDALLEMSNRVRALKRPEGDQGAHGPYGKTLRDHFAGLAMQGMLAHSTRYRPREQDNHLHWHEALAKEAHEIADAMLAEREKRDGASN